jgi:hypothetical protein
VDLKSLPGHEISNRRSFAYPFNAGSDEASVIDVVAKYYDIARTIEVALSQ